MEEGQKVIASGSIEVYAKSGQYQLYANRIVRDGQGDLFQKFEQLKKQLEEMGMFAPEYKKPIPKYAKTVGVVTAETGAAIHDIMNIASRRNPYVQLILCPAKVQGEGAAESIVRAIGILDAMGTDVMIVGRGGGSIEDLWAFNEEIVARAVFSCRTPVISAVGHETDWTIADFVADLRAPTPSAAAELAVFDYALFERSLAETRQKLRRLSDRKTDEMRKMQEYFRLKLLSHSPERELNTRRQALADISDRMELLMSGHIRESRRDLELSRERMERGIAAKLSDRQKRLQVLAGRLDGRSPLRKISGGFGFVTDKSDARIDTVDKAVPGEQIRIRMRDGRISALVSEVEKEWQNS